MENVAGATISANNFKIMLGELMGGDVVTGDTEVREIAPLHRRGAQRRGLLRSRGQLFV